MPRQSKLARAVSIAADLTSAAAWATAAAWRTHAGKRRAASDKLRAQFLIEGDPTTGLSPAARYRVQQFVPLLEDMDIACDVRPSTPSKYFSAGSGFQRAYTRFPKPALAYAYAQQLRQRWHRRRDFLAAREADVVLLQRDLQALPHSKLDRELPWFNRHIVFDFDDAIFSSPSWTRSEQQDEIDRLMHEKISHICGMASVVIAANPFLAAYAREFNDRVEIVPTCLDTEEFCPPESKRHNPIPVIGWIGTSGNLRFVRAIAPALAELAREHEFVLRVICNRVPESELPELPDGVLEFVEWQADGEVERIQDLDIGVMPLDDDTWTRGKAGFKLIQYMACGVPCVYSPVGANPAVVGDCGLAAESARDWIAALARLLTDANLCRDLGRRGRERAVEQFDRRVHAPTIARILREAADV